MKNITVEEILESPYQYEDMLVHVKYRTGWYYDKKKNVMRQDEAYYTGRILFITSSKIQIGKAVCGITVPIGYFIWILQADDPPLLQILAKENCELKHTINQLKALLEK
jgi:hypothetical protein